MGHLRLRQFAFAASLAFASACTVGDINSGDNGTTEPETDAGEEVVNLNYDMLTAGPAVAGPYIHYVSDTMIYAQIGDKICMWDGTTWVEKTGSAVIGVNPAPLGAYFHFISETEIYAFVGQGISRWNGVANAWEQVTDLGGPNLNLHPGSQFHFVSINEIYAFYGDPVVGLSINMWNGENWDTVMSAPALGLQAGGLHYIDAANMYAVSNDRVCKYDPELQTWASMTGDAMPGIQPDFELIAENNIHAVIDLKICQWDGLQWNIMVEDAPMAIAPYFHLTPAPSFYYAIGMDGLVYKSK